MEKACLGLVPVGQMERPRPWSPRFLKRHFSVVFLDFWSPVTDRHGNREILTMLDELSGFAAVEFIDQDMDAKRTAMKAFRLTDCSLSV